MNEQLVPRSADPITTLIESGGSVIRVQRVGDATYLYLYTLAQSVFVTLTSEQREALRKALS